jgi:hypothetical protein
VRNPPYLAYLLRMWRAQQGDQGHWCASLEEAETHSVRGFDSLGSLFAYLSATATGQGPGIAADPEADTAGPSTHDGTGGRLA